LADFKQKLQISTIANFVAFLKMYIFYKSKYSGWITAIWINNLLL